MHFGAPAQVQYTQRKAGQAYSGTGPGWTGPVFSVLEIAVHIFAEQ